MSAYHARTAPASTAPFPPAMNANKASMPWVPTASNASTTAKPVLLAATAFSALQATPRASMELVTLWVMVKLSLPVMSIFTIAALKDAEFASWAAPQLKE